MITEIQKVLHTLDAIEVHGRDNIDMLLGCMMTLEQIENELKEQAKKPETEEVTENG